MSPALAMLVTLAHASTLLVGPHRTYRTVAAAVAAARSGDTVRVSAGVYHEHVTIDRRIVLLGDSGSVLDGDRTGTVLTIRARATVRGLTIRHSGREQFREDGGIVAFGADSLVIEDNRLEDVLFGVYLKECDAALVRSNAIVGKDLPVALRGDGIRLWSSHDGTVEGNDVERVRDVVIWFSNRAAVRDNVVRDSRYGLHYMYSNHNVFTGNSFTGNHVGAFIMYSDDIGFRDNVFADARGTTGRGLGFKDADHIFAEGNILVRNTIGLSMDNSPHSEGVTNVFRENVIAFNDVGVALLPSVHGNDFLKNDFRDNVVSVRVSGGGTALENRWHGNYWSAYAGFDANHDGRGDTPFVLERLSDDLLTRHEPLQLFALSPAVTALDILSRVFPLLAPEPVVIDSTPQLHPLAPAAGAPRRGHLIPAVALLAAGLAAARAARRWRRPSWRPA